MKNLKNKGYKVTFNPPGNGKCHFVAAAVARHPRNIEILLSP